MASTKRRSAFSARRATPVRNWCGCCSRHPRVEIALLTADRRAGQEMREVFPQFSAVRSADARRHPDARLDRRPGLDLVFCALPHATTQQVVEALLGQVPAAKIVDLSADFRLSDVAAYARWYGHEHHAPDFQKAGRLRPGRGVSARHQACAARRQSGLLHDLRAAAADSAAQGEGDRSGRDRDRREIGHDRGGARGQGGDDLFRSLRGLPRLRRRPSPPHGRARPGILSRRGPRR